MGCWGSALEIVNDSSRARRRRLLISSVSVVRQSFGGGIFMPVVFVAVVAMCRSFGAGRQSQRAVVFSCSRAVHGLLARQRRAGFFANQTEKVIPGRLLRSSRRVLTSMRDFHALRVDFTLARENSAGQVPGISRIHCLARVLLA